MEDTTQENGFVQLVYQARQGDRESMGHLAQITEPRLLTYIYRLTLNYDLSQELCQQVQVKMVESLHMLRQVDRFWPWLFRCALGQVQHYFRDQRRTHMIEIAVMHKERFQDYVSQDLNDGLDRAARSELTDIIFQGITQLRLAYRNVLVLRCYEGLSYAEIAQFFDCKELHARMLFFRAKNALRKHLAREGIGKEALLTALGLFGFLTSPAKGATAGTVAASSLDVGMLASVTGVLITKTGMAIATAVTALVVGVTFHQIMVACLVALMLMAGLIVGLYFEG
jgi:RNA polymerase sigma-70 factor (ECF subfamily)